ncbi:hypothetical protein RvY_00051 [Ramazzottius varieornatus]|uniref:Uncharacterized protein n=1 Tax=Ramazzottius varieornatus TaxID=947166 RepID=A0A1D1ULX7_RAMVA|nr:hypothetical protein RvY_00051 [Ramazzottius varieornatus]
MANRSFSRFVSVHGISHGHYLGAWGSQKNLRGSAVQPGFAANKAEELKRHKYRELDGRYLFCPVAFETFGPFGNKASSLIQQIGKRIAEATGETGSLVFEFDH